MKPQRADTLVCMSKWLYLPVLFCMLSPLAVWAAEPAPPADPQIIDNYTGWKPRKERVVLIHDLFGMPVTMGTLATKFRKAGFTVDSLGYNPLSAEREAILPAMIGDIYGRMRHYSDDDDETVHFVCHAFGCVIAHTLIARHRPQKLGRVLMLIAPYQATYLKDNQDYVERLLQHPRVGVPNRLMLQSLLDAPIAYDAAILTGNRMSYPQHVQMLYKLPDSGVIDQHVPVPALAGTVPMRILSANQETLINNTEVLTQGLYYMEHGEFPAAAR